MRIFKIIDVDLDAARVKADSFEHPGRHLFNQRQRKALHKLYDLFEAGKWQECLDHVRNPKAFPRKSYPETEHIAMDVNDVLCELGRENFLTQSDLLEQAREKLKEEDGSLRLRVNDRVRTLVHGYNNAEGYITSLEENNCYYVQLTTRDRPVFFSRSELDYLP